MILEGLTAEEISHAVKLGDRIVAWRSRNSGALSTIDATFTKLEEDRIAFASDPTVVAELNALTEELKLAMFNIYMKY